MILITTQMMILEKTKIYRWMNVFVSAYCFYYYLSYECAWLRLVVAISSSLALAEQTQIERNIQDGEDDSEIILTSMMISEVCNV